MKVAIDASTLSSLNQTRGIGIYANDLFTALKKTRTGYRYILALTSKQLKNADLIHFPTFDFFFLTLPLRKTTKWVITVHDVIPLVFPEKFPSGLRGTFKFKLQLRSLKKAESIITDSHNSKIDIQKYLGIPDSKIHVVPLGVSKEFRLISNKTRLERTLKHYKLKRPFILYVGDVNYNKNLPTLLKAFAKLKGKHVELVLVSQAWKNKALPEVKALNDLMQTLDIQDRMRLISDLGSNPVHELVHLYNLADVYVQPSLYEGFGLPVLEAMACGTPVVTTNVASLPEVAGSAAITVPPNTDGISQGLFQALSLELKEKTNLSSLGQRQAAKFTWEKTAQKTLRVYNQVLMKV